MNKENNFIEEDIDLFRSDNLKLIEKKSNNRLFPKRKLNLGQKAADQMTKWAGSWTFITLFFIFLLAWISTNGYFVLNYWRGNLIDPYPYILLNLALSCLAAIQAPIILMSQNREAERDRIRAEYDYAVNRKAEREIREIQKKLEEIKTTLYKKR